MNHPTSTTTGLRLALLAVLLLAIAGHLVALTIDTAQGFCFSLEPCQTTEETQQ